MMTELSPLKRDLLNVIAGFNGPVTMDTLIDAWVRTDRVREMFRAALAPLIRDLAELGLVELSV